MTKHFNPLDNNFEIPEDLQAFFQEAEESLNDIDEFESRQGIYPLVLEALKTTLSRDKETILRCLDKVSAKIDEPGYMDAEDILHRAHDFWWNPILHTRFHPRLDVGDAELCQTDGTFNTDGVWYEDGEEIAGSIQIGVEMDNEWWENEFSKPAQMAYRTFNELGEEEETHWLPNWEHLNAASKDRDALQAHLYMEIERARSLRDLERITRWAGLWARHGVLRDQGKTRDEKGNRITLGLDYRRYAEIVNECLLAACLAQEVNGIDRSNAIKALTMLRVEDPSKFKVAKEMAQKLTRWAQERLGKGFRAKAIQVYKKAEVSEEDSEDVMERCGQVGEFMVDEFGNDFLDIFDLDLSDPKYLEYVTISIAEYDRMRERMPRPRMQVFRLSEREVEAWLNTPPPVKSEAFAKLEDLFTSELKNSYLPPTPEFFGFYSPAEK